MIAIPSRHKSLTLLATVVVAQVLLLAVQIKRAGQVRLIRVWAVELISPVQRASSWVVYNFEHGWGNYVSLRNTRQDNQALRSELDRLKVRNAELEGRAHEGIRRDMGVITPDGVVGKILAAYPDISQVLLLGDKESGVGALLADTRTQGVVRGSGKPDLTMDYVSNEVKVSTGEAVLTSGQDRIFPKDLPVATVAETAADRKGSFMKIRLTPAAHLDRLEEVLVLLTRQDLDVK